MNCVAKDPEARALSLGERRVGGKLGYVTKGLQPVISDQLQSSSSSSSCLLRLG
jgi:hypothetical protein